MYNICNILCIHNINLYCNYNVYNFFVTQKHRTKQKLWMSPKSHLHKHEWWKWNTSIINAWLDTVFMETVKLKLNITKFWARPAREFLGHHMAAGSTEFRQKSLAHPIPNSCVVTSTTTQCKQLLHLVILSKSWSLILYPGIRKVINFLSF